MVYFATQTIEKTYKASTTLKVEQTTFDSTIFSNQISVATSDASEAARLIQTTAVSRQAAAKLDRPYKDGRALLGQISVEVEASADGALSSFVTIEATGNDPEEVADIANAFAKAVTEQRADEAIESIDESIASLTAQSESLEPSELDEATQVALAEQLQQLRALRATQQSTTQVIEQAVPPSAPISPNPKRNAMLALVAALLLSGALVALLDALDRRIHEVSGIDELSGSPLLGMIPRDAFPGRVPTPQVREAFQTLRSSLTYFNVDKNLSRILVTSPQHSEGKTTVAVNLAAAYALDGKRVILVDGDMRRPQAAERVGASPEVGLAEVLLEQVPLDQALIDVPVGGGDLQVLPSILPAPPNPSVLLGSERMNALLGELAERADIIIVDTPPVLAVSDAIGLLDRISGVVLIARLDQTSRDALVRAKDVIEKAHGHVVGVVATGARSGGLYGDGSGYGYGYSYGYSTAHQAPQVATNGSANGAKKPKRRLLGIGRRRS